MLKVSQQYLDKLLKSKGVRVTGKCVGSGRTNGATVIPPMIREVIGKVALTEGATAAAEAFGVSVARASDYSNGHIINGDGRLSSVTKFVEKAQEQAAEKLLHAIGVITDQEVEAAPLKVKLEVVDRFSRVVKNLQPPPSAEVSVRDSNVVIYRPEARREEDYEAITV